jgi:hypothetical protein
MAITLKGSDTSTYSDGASFASNVQVGGTDAGSTEPGGYVYSTRYINDSNRGSAALNGQSLDGDLASLLVIDRSAAAVETVIIKPDGSASFAGDIVTGNFNPGLTTTSGIELGVGGACSVQRTAAASSTSLVWRGLQGTTVSSSITTSGNATFAGNITAGNVSDIRFKENITDAQPQLADVVTLGSQLKNWDWKEEAPLNEELKAKRFLGLIAQESEKVCPSLTYTVNRTKTMEITPAVIGPKGRVITEAVTQEVDDSYKAINHDIIVMKLLGAVAEQNTRIEALVSSNGRWRCIVCWW